MMSAGTVLALRWVDPPTSSFVLQNRALAGGAAARIQHRWVDYPDIAPEVALAVIAAEDQRFFDHFGFDFESILDAIEERRREGRLRGASTISQQVAKNLFLWPGRSWLRKGLEAYFTVLIEALWPKRRTLEIYLNFAQFGKQVFGVGAASQRFFGKEPSRLSAHEAALLASVLPAPSRLDVVAPSAYLNERVSWVVKQMSVLRGAQYMSKL